MACSGDEAVCFEHLSIGDENEDGCGKRYRTNEGLLHGEELLLVRGLRQVEYEGDHRCVGTTCGATADDSDSKQDDHVEDEANAPTKLTPTRHDCSCVGSSVDSPTPSLTSTWSSSSIMNCTSTLICDAWYGFPTQKRPRRERINAVGRQISNFLEWRHRDTQNQRCLMQQQQQQITSSSSSTTKFKDIDPLRLDDLRTRIPCHPCHVAFLGAMVDVQAVQKRVIELSQQEQQLITPSTDRDIHFDVCNHGCGNGVGDEYGGDGSAIQFQPDVTVQVFLKSSMLDRRQRKVMQQPQMNDEIEINSNDATTYEDTIINSSFANDNISYDTAIYLSPDASYTLPITCRPPRTVILGMLVDRHTIVNRSQQRAENVLGMKAAQLPLEELNVSGLYSNEPLNVDTAMEMMQRWWWNCDELEVKLQLQRQLRRQHCDATDTKDMNEAYRKCFLDAAAWALKSHRDRHPNRTLHSEGR